jgi:pyruvate dehydrogenase E1 component alpha subunit
MLESAAASEPAVAEDPERLRELYRLMVRIRRADEESLHLQRQGELGLWGQLIGQEAAQVGAAMALKKEDWIFPSYREFGMAICRGIDPADMLAWFRGLTHQPWQAREHRFAPFAIPVGTQLPHSVGFAMGCRLDASREVVLVTFGDGATSSGDWHEALNFAGVFKAPIVFFCQNNHWAISVPLKKQTAGSIAERAQGYGFPGIRIDGNDVLLVMRTVREAAERARAGKGPTLIEAMTYRMGAHTTADDPTRYRLEEELTAWRERDPIERYQEWLKEQGLLDDREREQIKAQAEAAAREMREKLLRMPIPDPGEAIFGGVFERPSAQFQRERQEFEESLES